jgi:ABC-type antimicrobial peptide transport system permease subunit
VRLSQHCHYCNSWPGALAAACFNTRALRTRLKQLLHFDANGWLAVLGVAIGVANIIALIGVTDTARHQAFALLRDYGAQAIFVNPYTGEGRSMFMRANAGSFLPMEYLDWVAAEPGVDAVAGVQMLPGHVSTGTSERVFVTVEGAQPDYPAIRGHKALRGRYISPAEEAARARVCCLGYTLPALLQLKGDPVGQLVEVEGEQFRVIGVMEEKGFSGFESFDQRVFIPLATAQDLFGLPGVHSILARARADADVAVVAKALDTSLRERAGLGPDDPPEAQVSSIEQLTGIMDSALDVFRILLGGVSLIALIVAGTGIMSVMLMSVLGRTREIGVRRAVGARRRDILWCFLSEALRQSVFGALLGIVLGLAGALGFCAIMDWQPHITGQTVLLAAGFSLIAGLVFGGYPAAYAARLKPMDCLRYE